MFNVQTLRKRVLQPSPATLLEEGIYSASRPMYYVDDEKMKQKQTKRLVGACAIGIFVVFFLYHFFSMKNTHTSFERDVHLVKKNMQQDDFCGHSNDVSSAFNFLIVAEELVMISPKIKRGIGPLVKAKVVDENLCDKPIEIFRNGSVIISYIPHHAFSPIPKTREEIKLSGGQSICAQHALDSKKKKEELRAACAKQENETESRLSS